jgi:HSP20 family molecular chaperone IbpA
LDALNVIGGRLGDLLQVVTSTVKDAATAAEDGADRAPGQTDDNRIKTHVDWKVSVGGVPMGAPGGTSEDAASRAERRKPASSTSAKTPEASAAREPLFELFIEANHVLVTFEVPGVALEEVKLLRKGQTLRLETSGTSRFRRDIDLPDSIALGNDPSRTLRNGILELRFETAAGGTI